MPVLDLRVTVADGDYERVMAAARATFGTLPDGNGGEREMTDAEIVEGIRQHGIGLIRQLVSNVERKAAIKAAEALQPTIEVS